MSDIFILLGFVLALLLIAGKLLEKDKTLARLFTILALSDFAIYHLISYLLYCKHPFNIPFLHQWAFVIEALGFILFLYKGPLYYGYCLSVVTAGNPFPKRYLLHFIPGIVFAAIYLPVAYVKASSADAGSASLFFPGHDSVFLFSVFLSVFIYDIYLISCILKLYPMLRKYPGNNLVFKVMILSYATGLFSASFWPIDIMKNVEFTDDVRIGSMVYLVILYLISCRYPERMVLRDAELKKGNYQKSQLQGLDIETTVSRLDHFVREEKAYKTELSLSALARKLDIRQHQLSEILNSYMNTTFANYINDHRVDEAKLLLESRGDMQIIEISLEIGFNSLSVFYREFKKRAGMSPAEYRSKFKS
jgi:AraC-like DNA-binding protein